MKKTLLHENQRGFEYWKSWYQGKMKIANPILEEFEKEFEGVIKMDNDLTRRLIGDPMRFIDTVLTDAINEYAGKQRFIEDVVRKNLLEKAYKFYDDHLRAFPLTMPSIADRYNTKATDANWYECEYFEIAGNRLTLSKEYEEKVRESFRNYAEGDAAEDFERIQAFEKQLNAFIDGLKCLPFNPHRQLYFDPIEHYFTYDAKARKYKLNNIIHI